MSVVIEKYADGGYPFFFFSEDGSTWCFDCAKQEDAEPPITGRQINYEDEWHCDGCGKEIEMAYPPDDENSTITGVTYQTLAVQPGTTTVNIATHQGTGAVNWVN